MYDDRHRTVCTLKDLIDVTEVLFFFITHFGPPPVQFISLLIFIRY